MSRRRRIRTETGGSVYYNIDESHPAEVRGAGFQPFDVMKKVASSITSKLTGKAAKKLAEKAVEKALEKGAEKVGEKTGQLIGEKIYDRFTPKGDIVKELQKELQASKAKNNSQSERPILKDSNSLKDSRSSSTKTKSISQQFQELLNLG